ncbi:MAG: 2-oxoacid:ferredoxin oxidoreductase subunit beta [Alphaproteobacteria bacterium]|nr:2-oxoacid:ferredoxin oxidoreductase subunit beta [Alphaproteobacteria bacterium]
MSTQPPEYAKKDFMSDQIIRWCPGCGDYSILSQVQTVFSQLGRPKEEFVVISGIGCSSRFPYYMNTYGFHTIHGRAPGFATGLKVTRPELSVWVVTGDGDGLSIGGNHLAHLLRRNVDLNVMLFNNRIYGLTKGQYSPTSEVGKKTKSTPMGSIDNPFNPLAFAIGSGATCVMRSIDVFAQHLRDTLQAADTHRGTSFVEIYQNCNIFNDGAFDAFTDRAVRDDRILYLEHGKPMVWGKTARWGLRLDGLALQVVQLGDDLDESHCLVHDATNRVLATMLADLDGSDGFPVPVGLFYSVQRPTYDGAFGAQIREAKVRLGEGDLHQLLHAGDTWKV